MEKITHKQYNAIHQDYRGVWSREDYPEYIRRKTVLENSLRSAIGMERTAGTALLIEGIHFEII